MTSSAISSVSDRCRPCTTNDHDALAAELAEKMWDYARRGTSDNAPFADAGAHWHHIFRQYARASWIWRKRQMDDAIAVLQAAVDRSMQGVQTGADVRLALESLRFVGVPAEAIRYFCESCQSKNDIGRSQSLHAALRRIETFRKDAK
ncbi:hypothetical protein [Sphingomonas crocodyli]|uniref:Uncharacterized protein n=1 Tax=Sphingomonas crocodyli TaxID=1979270 RepID=A0A437LXT1_9SPHN|nr:hypothetical protein [Sphingomonas crocodyli]RVT90187.1 hypothetical protein EOD43_17965 [Sphingomonas crocodyli]